MDEKQLADKLRSAVARLNEALLDAAEGGLKVELWSQEVVRFGIPDHEMFLLRTYREIK